MNIEWMALWLSRRSAPPPVAVAEPRSSGLLLFGALASMAAVGAGFARGWPLWVLLVLVGVLPWLPAFVADVAWLGRRSGSLALLYVLVVTQGGHFLEHVAQMVQIHLLGLSGPQARGIVGQLDLEWVHFGWNTWVLLAAVVLVFGFPSNGWLRLVALAATWHEVEHAYLLATYLGTGQAGTPGLLSAGGTLGGGLPIARPDLHFLYNLVETVPLLVAFAIEVRRAASLPRHAAADDRPFTTAGAVASAGAAR